MSRSLVRFASLAILAALVVSGCSKFESVDAEKHRAAASAGEATSVNGYFAAMSGQAPNFLPPPASGESGASFNFADAPVLVAVEENVPNGAEGIPGEGATTTPAGVDRKIVYSADVELVVEDFSGVPEKVVGLVKQYDGYVADSSLAGTVGTNRRATWRIRVPVAKFEEFLNATKGLGELLRLSTSSQDVSEEYYDVEARIRNKTKEEERLIKLLEERPGKLEDVIAIERELSRVREELERMQGRMRVLADLTSLTTVNLTINEVRDYEPPQAVSFATEIRRRFDGSIVALRNTGESLVLAAVGLGPWLVVLGVVFVPPLVVLRRRWRRSRSDRAAARGAMPTA